MRKLTDENVLDFIQSGNPQQQDEAFRSLYKEYYGLIESLVLKNNGNKESAKDIFQEGIIVFFNKAKSKSFHLTSTIKTYLYAVCRTRWLMHLRESKRETSLEDKHEFIAMEDSDLDTLEVTNSNHIMMDLFDKIGEDCKRVLLLFYYKKMRMAEISQLLNMASEQVAKNKKSRCMKRLRTMVNDNPNIKAFLR